MCVKGKTFEYEGENYSATTRYKIDQEDAHKFDQIIPDNIFSLDRKAMAPIVEGVMERMNVIWSSTNGVANFPENFGDHTKLSIHYDRIFMSGYGWAFSIWNGSRADIMSRQAKAVGEILQRDISDEEKAKEVTDLIGKLPTKIGG